MNSVCIIGAGTMGVGIAQWFANIGLQVFITDSKSEVLDVAKEGLRARVRCTKPNRSAAQRASE